MYLCSIENKVKTNSVKVLLLDNYDSFTFNLYHYLDAHGAEVLVRRNDEISLEETETVEKIVLSPGPGLPQESGKLLSIIDFAKREKPILGVCLGMQALAIDAGGDLINLQKVKHGISEIIEIDTCSKLFHGFHNQLEVGLYHSWAVKRNFSSDWNEIAWNSEGILMAMEHKNLPLYGVQFHPESVMTPLGKKIIHHFLTKL